MSTKLGAFCRSEVGMNPNARLRAGGEPGGHGSAAGRPTRAEVQLELPAASLSNHLAGVAQSRPETFLRLLLSGIPVDPKDFFLFSAKGVITGIVLLEGKRYQRPVRDADPRGVGKIEGNGISFPATAPCYAQVSDRVIRRHCEHCNSRSGGGPIHA